MAAEFNVRQPKTNADHRLVDKDISILIRNVGASGGRRGREGVGGPRYEGARSVPQLSGECFNPPLHE